MVEKKNYSRDRYECGRITVEVAYNDGKLGEHLYVMVDNDPTELEECSYNAFAITPRALAELSEVAQTLQREGII